MKRRRKISWQAGFLLTGVASFVVGAAPAMGEPCPATPAPGVTAAIPPKDVCIPAGFTGLTLDYFDDYSWKAFVAMVWPSLYGSRGIPDDQRTYVGSGARVFETFKPLWEIFHRDGSPPASPDFEQYEAPLHNACQARAGYGDMVLGSDSGIHDIGQAGDGGLLGPPVAQNRDLRPLPEQLQRDCLPASGKQQMVSAEGAPGDSRAPPPDPTGRVSEWRHRDQVSMDRD